MKILTSEQIRNVDAETIKRESISSLELMMRASTAFYHWFIDKYSSKNTSVLIFSGVGNNGGDGLVIARLLHKSGYNVKVCVVEYSGRYTEDCAHNIRRVKAENISFSKITNENQIPDIRKYDVVIDAIFGTGLSRDISGIAETVIKRINESGKTVLSIDVPSGLFMEKETVFAVKATETVTFQIPKLALFLPENHIYTGSVTIINIGLNEQAISETESNIYYTEKHEIRKLLKPLTRFAHKGTEGHALIVGGSLGKIGSVCLSSKGALKTGCGLVTAYLPKCGVPVIQMSFPEAMSIEDKGDKYITSINFDMKPDAIGLGMGMGQHKDTQSALYDFLNINKTPLVIDADGLNMLAKHKEWLSLINPKTILTPHPGELSRLIGEWKDDHDKIQKTLMFAQKYDLIIVVKGAYSLIIDSENIYMNSTGTPALATAGSGDVLTGMITSLLAQGYKPIDAARVGVYLHGMTSDLTIQTIHPRSFVASDIIENIGNAFIDLEKSR